VFPPEPARLLFKEWKAIINTFLSIYQKKRALRNSVNPMMMTGQRALGSYTQKKRKEKERRLKSDREGFRDVITCPLKSYIRSVE
jgi:hypothetical protein